MSSRARAGELHLVARFLIDLVQERLAAREPGPVIEEEVQLPGPESPRGYRRNMRREQYLAKVPQWTGRRQRFFTENIQDGAPQLSALETVDERDFIQERAARDVH